MRKRLSFTLLVLLLAVSACSRAAEITSPATPVHPLHTDAAGDTTKHGPGLFGSGN